eukprot:TRINITY_DN4317_c0_g1_i2.p1 TRINITY_DN4317_c0_g1~~TRINITY_DN4317_c0_g1_i2.p1  ORF type:complete len:1016 (+),score=216.65 TRINITY_DN4317_c0_g1_i2:237-3050(+)
MEKVVTSIPPCGYDLGEVKAGRASITLLGVHVPILKPLTDFVLEFKSIVETYGFGANALSRKTFKEILSVLPAAQESITDFLGEPAQPVHTLDEIEDQWENSVLGHVKSSTILCITLWVVDKILEQEIAANDTDPNVIILATTPANFEKYLSKLSNIVSESFVGRLRIVIDVANPEPILTQLKSSEIGAFSFPVIMNKESIENQDSLGSLSALREGLITTSGTMGFANFVKFSSILWVGKGDPALNMDFAKNGVIVHSVETSEEALKIFSVNQHWVTHCKHFRIVINDDDMRTEVPAICYKVRIQQKCYAPIFIKITDINAYDISALLFPPTGFMIVHSLPFIKESSDPNELLSYGFMSSLPWARPEIMSSNTLAIPAPTDSSAGTLHIHSVSAQHLFPMDPNGKSDPFLNVWVNVEDAPREKTKVIKKTLFPDWSGLDWKLDVKLNDQLRFEVYDWDRVGGNDFEGHACRTVSQLISCTGEKTQVTVPLRSQDPLNAKKSAKVRGTLRIECTWTYKEKPAPPPPKHFGRPLAESIQTAEKEGTVHPVPATLAALYHLLQTEGLFRLPGSANNVTQLQGKFDKGKIVDLTEEPVHDVGSLCKAYFAMLPDPLLPQSFYEEYKEISKLEADAEEKKEKTLQLISKLPLCNQEIFIDLVSFLKAVSVYSETNKMTPGNLAVCWTPTIITPHSVSNDPEKMLFDSHTTTQYLAWIIENARELWPAKDAAVIEIVLNESQFIINAPSRLPAAPVSPIRPPPQLLQRHLAIDETEENSMYLAQFRTIAFNPPPAPITFQAPTFVDEDSTEEEEVVVKTKKSGSGRRVDKVDKASSKKDKDVGGRILSRAKSGKKSTSSVSKKQSGSLTNSSTPPATPPTEHQAEITPKRSQTSGFVMGKRPPGENKVAEKAEGSAPEEVNTLEAARAEAARARAVPVPSGTS